MKSLLWREWRLMRVPFVVALAAQLAWLLLHSNRNYGELLRFHIDPPLPAMLFAAWLAYHRFYAEQVRGTWLLQPFSRDRLVWAKVLAASACLLALGLVQTLTHYAWVASSPAPGGPILSIRAYAWNTLSVHCSTTHAVLFGASIASFARIRWVQVLGVAAGLAWAYGVMLDTDLLELRAPWLPVDFWCGLALGVIALLGSLTIIRRAREIGREASSPTRILDALWLTPLALIALSFGADIVPEPTRPFHPYDTVKLLRDGEIVVAHVDQERRVVATRQDGRVVQFRRFARTSSEQDEPREEASFHRPRGPHRFGQSTGFADGKKAFVAEDGRSLSIYEERGGQAVGVACWGAHGMRQGTVQCAPGPQIIAMEPMEGALLVVTNEGVHVLDTHGDHVRLRAPNIQGATAIGEESIPTIAVFTEDALIVTGAVERRCPASVGAAVGLLDDSTVVMLDDQVLTYCREAGTSTAPWPLIARETDHSRYLDPHLSLLLPFGDSFFASPSTYGLAAFLRIFGAAIVIAIARKRGLIHALIGLVLGRAFLLAAILAETEFDMVSIVRNRALRRASSR